MKKKLFGVNNDNNNNINREKDISNKKKKKKSNRDVPKPWPKNIRVTQKYNCSELEGKKEDIKWW